GRQEVLLSIPAWYASMVANVMVPMRKGQVEVALVCERLDCICVQRWEGCVPLLPFLPLIRLASWRWGLRDGP
ncbi:MAG: hypothetical protein WCF79_24500, partial [Rhodomicrobium sp.]